jgi:hypothetical protein
MFRSTILTAYFIFIFICKFTNRQFFYGRVIFLYKNNVTIELKTKL